MLLEIDGKAGEDVGNSLSAIFPDLVRYMIEYVFGDIYSRETFNLKSKEIAVVAALTALGNTLTQLKFHINAGLNLGLTVDDIKEIMLLMSVYAGFSSAINGTNSLKEVLDERRYSSLIKGEEVIL